MTVRHLRRASLEATFWREVQLKAFLSFPSFLFFIRTYQHLPIRHKAPLRVALYRIAEFGCSAGGCCHVSYIKKKNKRERERKEHRVKDKSKQAGARNEPRAHTHTSPADALLWINTRRGAEKGTGVKLREAREEKNIGTQSRPLPTEDEPPVFDGCRRASSPKHKKPHLGFHSSRWNLPVPATRHLTVSLLTFDLSGPLNGVQRAWSSRPLHLRKAIWTKVLQSKARRNGRKKEKKKNNFHFLWRSCE